MKRIILKEVLFMFMLVFVFGCSGTKMKNDEKKLYINENTVYRVNDVKVYLESKCDRSEYPDDDELSEKLTQKIKERFCAKMKCLNENEAVADNAIIVDLDFNLNYERIFFGQAFSCKGSYLNSYLYFNNVARKDDKVITSYNVSKTRKVKIFRGQFGEFKHNLASMTGKNDKEAENKSLDIIADNFSKEMIKLLK